MKCCCVCICKHLKILWWLGRSHVSKIRALTKLVYIHDNSNMIRVMSIKTNNKTMGFFRIFLAFDFCRFCVVIRFVSSPPQRPMTSDFDEFSIPDFIHYIYVPILILEKEPVFSFLMFSAKQGHYWYHYYIVFGITRSLTGDWTRVLPHSMLAIYH